MSGKVSFEVLVNGAFMEATFTPEAAQDSYDRYQDKGAWKTIELVRIDRTLLRFAQKIPMSEGHQE